MGQAVLRIEKLPDAPLDAAAAFHAEWLPQAREALAGAKAVVLSFPPAPHPHRAWRLAAVQELAREAAPGRVNGVEGNAGAALVATLDYLARSSGVTGQLLAADGGKTA